MQVPRAITNADIMLSRIIPASERLFSFSLYIITERTADAKHRVFHTLL